MKKAAVTFGVLACIASCIAAYFTSAVMGHGAHGIASTIAIVSAASILGTAVLTQSAAAGGGILLCVALAWFIMGLAIGSGFNILNSPFIILNALAGVLGLSAGSQHSPSTKYKYEPNDRPGDGPYST